MKISTAAATTRAISASDGGSRTGLVASLFSAGGTLGLAVGPVVSIVFLASLGLSFTPWLMIPGNHDAYVPGAHRYAAAPER